MLFSSRTRPRPVTAGAPAGADAGSATAREVADRGARGSRWARLPTALRRAILLVAIVALWQAYVSLTGVSALAFAAPLDVLGALIDDVGSGKLVTATLTTLKILGLGMGIGMAVAAVLTTLASATRIGDDILALLTSMLNPLPAIAILPLAILWFGLSETALIFVIANAVTWPIAINVNMGFRTINATILAVGRNIGLRGWGLVRDVLLPAALPHIITGLKTGWAFGWRTIIAAELVFGVAGGGGGLGNYINQARYFLQIPDVFAGLVTMAVIGIPRDTLHRHRTPHRHPLGHEDQHMRDRAVKVDLPGGAAQSVGSDVRSRNRQKRPAGSCRACPCSRTARSSRRRSAPVTCRATSVPASRSSCTAIRESSVKPPDSTARLRLCVLASSSVGDSATPRSASAASATARVPDPDSRVRKASVPSSAIGIDRRWAHGWSGATTATISSLTSVSASYPPSASVPSTKPISTCASSSSRRTAGELRMSSWTCTASSAAR